MERLDDDLWQRCTRDDAAALADLFRRHARAIHLHAFRSTADWTRADDVLSSTFLEAWRRRHDARVPSGMVVAWLHGIATNVARNEQRSARRAQRLQERARASVEQPQLHEDELIQRLDDEARAGQLLETLRELPRVERETVALCWWAGLTYEAAALALDVPVGTIRSRLNRVRRRVEQATALPVAASTTEGGR